MPQSWIIAGGACLATILVLVVWRCRASRRTQGCTAQTALHGLISAASIVTLMGLWWLVTTLHLVEPLFMPSPETVAKTFHHVLFQGYRGTTLLEHLGYSMYRVLTGFGLAVATAVPLGLIMGRNAILRAVVDPLIEMYRPLPPLAYYTLLIVWLGIGDTSKIALLYLAAFPPIYISTMTAVRQVPISRIECARCLGISGWPLLRRVIFPSALPGIFIGLRVSIGFTYTTLVSSEIVAAVNGIGWLVLDAGRFLRTDLIFVGIITMGATGLLLDRLIRIMETLVVPWKEE
ncbi:ABC transporter permease [Desulfonatronum thioautotrophicum]|uniref:ABC transporter permease n=1 Tax=Desulfonatronum thioautotrophicum TaxID=617001 RepID=UPI0009FE0B65|nr:ABC transporter permease [Desulfonatronum thioautotrophicum]